jgi:hypothetical protein
MQWKDTNIIVVTVGKLCLRVRKLEGESLDMYSHMKDFVHKNKVEISDTAIDPSHQKSFGLSAGQVFYFPSAVSDKYKWITDPFHTVSRQNYDCSLVIYLTSLEVQFLGSLV